MIKIPLKNAAGKTVAHAIVSPEDAILRTIKWHLSRKGYVRKSVEVDGRKRDVYLHRYIMGVQHGDTRHVDHLNGDTLDCRRENLEIVEPSENRIRQSRRLGHGGYRELPV